LQPKEVLIIEARYGSSVICADADAEFGSQPIVNPATRLKRETDIRGAKRKQNGGTSRARSKEESGVIIQIDADKEMPPGD
jgi:hypothetical protein